MGILIPTPYKILGGVVLMLGVSGTSFYSGYHVRDLSAKKEMLELVHKADLQKQELMKKNEELSNKTTIVYLDKVKVVTEKQIVYVKTTETVVPKQHQVSEGWVYTHNQAALNKGINATLASNPRPSGTYDNEVLTTVVTNYSNCEADREQLRQLQSFIRDWNKEIEKTAGDNK